MIKVSVILSVFKEPSSYIKKTIKSIISQSLKEIEIIVILDCPKNATAKKLINSYQKNDNSIIFIQNKTNIGLTQSLNKGILASKGKYIARIDTGDIALRSRLIKQYNILENDPETFLVGSYAGVINENDQVIGHIKVPVSQDEINSILPKKNPFIHSSIMFRGKGRGQGVFYREKFLYSQDYDLYLRLLSLNKKMINIPRELITYRYSSISISFKKKTEQNFFAQMARKFYKQRLKHGVDSYQEFNFKQVQPKKKHPANPSFSSVFFMLKIGNFSEAKKIFDRMNGQEKKSILGILTWLMTSKPSFYNYYRRFFSYYGF